MDEKSNNESKKFIQENVSKKTSPGEKACPRPLKVMGLGVLFGISALITMVLLRPAAVRYLTAQEQAAESSSIPDDPNLTVVDSSGAATDPAEDASGAALSADGSAEDPSAASAAAESQSSDGGQADGTASGDSQGAGSSASGAQDSSEGSPEPTLDDMTSLWQQIADIGEEADRYIVDVCSIKNATDWFDNHFEKNDIYSGIIISADDSEVCVLTLSAAVSSADSLRVSLNDGRLFPAALKKADFVTGLAVISFDPEDEGMVSAETIDASHVSKKEYEPIEAVAFDTTCSADRGDLVIAVGSPRGITHSAAYSWLSYKSDTISITDGTTRLFYADRDMDCSRGTWVIDLEGKLIGWLCDDIKEDSTDSQVIMSITDYRDILETMVEGKDQAYLGVSVIDTDMIHTGPDYPEGVYVKSVAFGGPAYNSGLQPGDYIADIGGHRITSLRSFKYAMSHIQAGSTVTVLIYRQSKEDYKNIVFEVETGTRSSR